MKRLLLAWVAGMAMLGAASAQVVGTYKLLTFTVSIDDGTSYDYWGAQPPSGYAVITPKRFMVVIAASDRKPGREAEDKLALFNSMIAYSGPYSIVGTKLMTDVDVSWNQAWTGTRQGRTWSLEGDKLVLVTDKAPSIKDPSKMAVARLVWQKVE